MSRIDGPLRLREYTARDFSAIQQDLLTYIKRTRPTELNSFFEGDVAKVLIELIAYCGDMLSFSVDRVGEEAFLATCRLFESALRHANSVAYQVATANGASAVLVPVSYEKIPAEIKVASAANEVHTITLAGNPTSGTWTFTFSGETSVAIAHNASAVTVRSTLEAMAVIGEGNVTVTGDDGGPYTVTFVGDLGFTNVAASSGTATNLRRNAIQSVVLSPVPSSGVFRLTFNSGAEETGDLAYNATSSQIETAIELLPSIGAGNVSVTGSASAGFEIEFVGTLVNSPQDLFEVSTNTLDAGGPVSVLITEVQDGAAQSVASVVSVEGYDNTYNPTFKKGTIFQIGTQTWEVTDDTTIIATEVTPTEFQTAFEIPVSSGRSFEETYTSTGVSFQTFTTQNTNVIEGTLEVYVGDTETPWTRVSTLSLAAGDEQAYSVRFDSMGRAVISFGDGNTGAVPAAAQTIYVQAKSGGGAATNIGTGGIKVSLQGLATNSDDVSIAVSVPVVNIAPATGGRDRESLEEIRRNIPAYLRTVDKAITKEDYETLSSQYESDNGSVSRAAAYLETAAILYQTDGPLISESDPLHVEAGTSIVLDGRTFEFSKNFHSTHQDPMLWVNPNLVTVYVWSTGDLGFEASSEALQIDLLRYLQDRSVITTTIRILPGRQRVIDINLGVVKYFSAYTKGDVEEAIIDAARAYFISDEVHPATPFRLSDFYQKIENVEGVDHFVIQSPEGDIEVEKDEIPILGVLTFTLEQTLSNLDTFEDRDLFNDELFDDGMN